MYSRNTICRCVLIFGPDASCQLGPLAALNSSLSLAPVVGNYNSYYDYHHKYYHRHYYHLSVISILFIVVVIITYLLLSLFLLVSSLKLSL